MDIKHLLRASVDMDWVRTMTNVLILALLITALVGLITGGLAGAGLFAAIGLVVELPLLISLGRRCWNIFHQQEHYRQYQCTLSSLNTPGLFSFWKTIAFYVVLEEPDGSKEVVSTNPIFFPNGIESPQLKDYVNRTVTVAYNPLTGSVVVIG